MEVNKDTEYILGFDIGGTKISGILSDIEGNVKSSSRRLTVKP